MTTPTRDELAAMIDPYWDDDLYRLKRVADVVLPLLRERDDKIVSLDTSVASLEATIAERDAEIERLRALLGHEADDAYKWRECADQLAAAINNGFGAHITTPAGEALAEYERLAGDP